MTPSSSITTLFLDIGGVLLTNGWDRRIQTLAKDVPTPVLALSLLMRFRSRQEDSFGAKVIAALRNEFGGHPVKSAE